MERVAFVVEATQARVTCLLNPQTFVVHRRAGLALQAEDAGRIAGRRRRDDPVLYTGGGVTELELSLLFDVEIESTATPRTPDVRAYSGPLVDLAERPADRDAWGALPLVRFVWGKAWNVPGVIVSISETLERFSPQGVPMRSWVRLRFRRQIEDVEAAPAELGPPPVVLQGLAARPVTDVPAPGAEDREVAFRQGDRLDDLAARHYGDPRLWRFIAWVNDIVDPFAVPPGTVLRLPPPTLPPPPAPRPENLA